MQASITEETHYLHSRAVPSIGDYGNAKLVPVTPTTVNQVINGEVLPPEVRLRERLGGDIWDRSEFHRRRLQRAGFRKGGVHHLGHLRRVAPMTLADVVSPRTLMLADPQVTAKNKPDFRYWPLHWVETSGLALGYSDEDLELLEGVGAKVLIAAGLRRSDVLAALLPATPSREWWQFLLGARLAGISSVPLGTGRSVPEIEVFDPSVLLGGTKELARLLEDAAYDQLSRVHTILAVDDAGESVRDRLVALCHDRSLTLVRLWAPAGVLALWGQCRNGDAFHIFADHEICEVVDPDTGLPCPENEPGVVVWTGVGWYASAVLRLQTDEAVIRLSGPCPACGRTSPRVQRFDGPCGLRHILNDQPEVALWYAELQRIAGRDELVVWIALTEPHLSLKVLETIGARVGLAQVSVVSSDEVRNRIDQANGEQLGDRRAVPQEIG